MLESLDGDWRPTERTGQGAARRLATLDAAGGCTSPHDRILVGIANDQADQLASLRGHPRLARNAAPILPGGDRSERILQCPRHPPWEGTGRAPREDTAVGHRRWPGSCCQPDGPACRLATDTCRGRPGALLPGQSDRRWGTRSSLPSRLATVEPRASSWPALDVLAAGPPQQSRPAPGARDTRVTRPVAHPLRRGSIGSALPGADVSDAEGRARGRRLVLGRRRSRRPS